MDHRSTSRYVKSLAASVISRRVAIFLISTRESSFTSFRCQLVLLPFLSPEFSLSRVRCLDLHFPAFGHLMIGFFEIITVVILSCTVLHFEICIFKSILHNQKSIFIYEKMVTHRMLLVNKEIHFSSLFF